MQLLKNKKSQLIDFLRNLGELAASENTKIHIVGGYVRDKLLGIASKDLDFIVEGDAIEFAGKCSQNLAKTDTNKQDSFQLTEIFADFGTCKIQAEGLDFEIEFASARKESYKGPATFPRITGFCKIEEDLKRRDFRINALMISIMPDNFGELIDLVEGLVDIENKLVRVFHDKSFIDDPTRIYRAARFAAKLGFEIEAHTLDLMKDAAKNPDFPKWFKKRKSRFQIELDYINNLEEEETKKALAILESAGL